MSGCEGGGLGAREGEGGAWEEDGVWDCYGSVGTWSGDDAEEEEDWRSSEGVEWEADASEGGLDSVGGGAVHPCVDGEGGEGAGLSALHAALGYGTEEEVSDWLASDDDDEEEGLEEAGEGMGVIFWGYHSRKGSVCLQSWGGAARHLGMALRRRR